MNHFTDIYEKSYKYYSIEGHNYAAILVSYNEQLQHGGNANLSGESESLL